MLLTIPHIWATYTPTFPAEVKFPNGGEKVRESLPKMTETYIEV